MKIQTIQEAEEQLRQLGVTDGGVAYMAPKCLSLCIKLHDVAVGAANILKQEMLSLGGDAAVARGVVNGSTLRSDVLLLGTVAKLQKLVDKLSRQSFFGLDAIRQEVAQCIRLQLAPITSMQCGATTLHFSTPAIMGILNVTPDSFSDGNKWLSHDAAVEYALQMIEDGAQIIDIGGESTRPGAAEVTAEQEIARVMPVIETLRRHTDCPISIDTHKAVVADAALAAGASIINDISAFTMDAAMVDVALHYPAAPLILMHMQGTPQTMQNNPHYHDVMNDILGYLAGRIQYCTEAGIARERIIIDPGVGFGKSHTDNLTILRRLEEFRALGVPVLLGASRKSFINRIYPAVPEDRLEGSLATTAQAFYQGAAIVRVHDVKAHKRLLDVLRAIREG